MLLVPVIQLTVFGYAIDLDIKHIPTVTYNLDGREHSRKTLDTFRNSGYFDFKSVAFSDQEMYDEIVRGDVEVAIKIPPDYTDDLLAGRKATIQVLIDGSNSNVAMQALNVANALALRSSISIVSSTFNAGDLPVEARPRVLFNPDMKTSNFMVPGLVGLVMQLVTMILTAFAIVREKENGTLEQLMVTPVSRLGLMIGKLVPFFVIGALETCFVLVIMRFLFDVPIAGSLLLLSVFSVPFLFTSLGLGLLVSTVASTQIQAVQCAFVIILPSVLLSGFIFPQENMPFPIYVIAQGIPLTYYMCILRGIILRGAGMQALWHHAAILMGMGIFVLGVSALRFRKTLT
jgi:ABC-type multidrug transport system permease subunit